MRRVVLRAGAAFALGLGMIALPVIADDTPSTTAKDLSQKAPTFPGYVYVSDVVGEVVKANDTSITVRITWFEPQVQKNTGRRNLSRNSRNFRNPFMPNMNRPKVTVKEVHHDYTLDYLPQSLVRLHKLPTRKDDKGRRIEYSQKEYDELRQPAGVTGFVANRSDLIPGTIVELILIRDKTIPAEKVADSDLRIKYAIIWGQDPNPPKDITNPPAAGSKNKKSN